MTKSGIRRVQIATAISHTLLLTSMGVVLLGGFLDRWEQQGRNHWVVFALMGWVVAELFAMAFLFIVPEAAEFGGS